MSCITVKVWRVFLVSCSIFASRHCKAQAGPAILPSTIDPDQTKSPKDISGYHSISISLTKVKDERIHYQLRLVAGLELLQSKGCWYIY